MEDQLTKGKETLASSSIIVCGIARDCGRNLKKNIKVIDMLCNLAKEYQVIIFENDSTDNTKQVLKDWKDNRPNVYVSLNDFNQLTIPKKEKGLKINPLFSCSRIEKMAKYRNFYLDYIEQNNIVGDYVVVLDLDVNKIFINGLIQSFSFINDWDAITANGYSRAFSSRFRRRYHDTYALIEQGKATIPKKEEDIVGDQYRLAKLVPGMPLIPVLSAFGGLTIYRREAINGCRYGVLKNNDETIECLTEHSFLYNQMKAKGYDKICINPEMQLKYQTQVFNTIKRFFKKFRK